jgi:hypothetical protein
MLLSSFVVASRPPASAGKVHHFSLYFCISQQFIGEVRDGLLEARYSRPRGIGPFSVGRIANSTPIPPHYLQERVVVVDPFLL